LGGVFFREFTRMSDFTGITRLSVVHTHALILGFFLFLILVLFEKSFSITESKWFNKFFITYNIGLAWSMIMFLVIGIMQVKGNTIGGALNGISGLGHIIMAVGFVFLFLNLKEKVLKEN
ncbi:MAG: DUF2871 family protein, partial [Clostridium sp.]|uniref:DUF2871 family protein n=1 Tax=Clostridium sp. TaxID=1506 RepID=UPI003EE4602B